LTFVCFCSILYIEIEIKPITDEKEMITIYEERMPEELNKKVGIVLELSLNKRRSLYKTEDEYEKMLGLKGENLYWVINVARGYYPHIGYKKN
jgi:hypothetical protein